MSRTRLSRPSASDAAPSAAAGMRVALQWPEYGWRQTTMMRTTRTITTAAMLAAAGMLTRPEPAGAQTVVPNGASVIEWNVPDTGVQPNALVINDVTAGKRGPVWYVATTPARLVRFTPGNPPDTQLA